MSAPVYNHWLGIVACGSSTRREPPGAVVAVVDAEGELLTVARLGIHYGPEEDQGLEALRRIVVGDFTDRPSGEWRPLVLLDLHAPQGRQPEPVPYAKAYSTGAVRGFLSAQGIAHLALRRQAWSELALKGARRHEDLSQADARFELARSRWPRFRRAPRGEAVHADAALLADVGRRRYRFPEVAA
jgi:hypothetical protein